MPAKTSETKILRQLDSELTAELRVQLPKVLIKAGVILNRSDLKLQSLHGIIGGKNNDYTDAIRTQFASPEDFNARWIHGLRQRVVAAPHYDNAATRIAKLMQNRLVRNYTLKFLTRNFYRNLIERTRQKPDDHLWRLWFGNNDMPWGLFIAPAYRDDEWVNDKSEIRRARYDYWTVGHVLETGIIDPDFEDIHEFGSMKALSQFYRSVIRRCSKSPYEKELAKRYVKYLKASNDLQSEPFLIPELRYTGLETLHRHRLDFTILNPHMMTFVGFELSPSSTHMAVKGIKKKTQKAVNAELAEKWEKESQKRRRYFQKFGITTVTFTDTDLMDLDDCFEQMKSHLSKRPNEPMSLEYQIDALKALKL